MQSPSVQFNQNGITNLTDFPQTPATSYQVPLTPGLNSQISDIANSTFFQVNPQEPPYKKQKTADHLCPLKDVPFSKVNVKVFGNVSYLAERVDTIIIVDNTEFRLHFEFLGSFPNLYQQAKKNKPDQPIIIQNCAARIFNKVLMFLYAGQVECEWEDLHELYQQACDYEVDIKDHPTLKKFCLNKLDQILNESGLSLSDEEEDHYLLAIELINPLEYDLNDQFYKKIHDYCVANAKAIFDTKPDMRSIGPDHFCGLLASNQLAMSELQILSYAFDWVEFPENIEAVKKCIRWDLIPDEDLNEVQTLTTNKNWLPDGTLFFTLDKFHEMLSNRSSLKSTIRGSPAGSDEST